MTDEWNQERLQKLIDNQEPESLRLEYKGRESLGRNNHERDEITKDISAMANADGGIVIFGISRPQDQSRRHLPQALDPIDSSEFSVEWLGQKIDLISPRLDREIIPIEINNDPNKVIYVVVVPKSDTAHQATNHVYYKRYDARSLPMADYEIRDVMGRSKHPNIQLRFKISTYQEIDRSRENVWQDFNSTITRYRIEVFVVNVGNVYAQYVNTFVHIPSNLTVTIDDDKPKVFKNDVEYIQFATNNLREMMTTYGPFLPHVSRHWISIYLASCFNPVDCGDCKIWWTAHGDSSPVREGSILFKEMEIV